MSRANDVPKGIERRRLLLEERRAKAKAEQAEVSTGVLETLALGHHRGEQFVAPAPERDGKPKPVRRISGLQFLAAKLSEDEALAGDRYGEAYRAVQAEESLKSCLAEAKGAGRLTPNPAWLLSRAEWRANQRDRLRRYRELMHHHPRLVEVCDLICGQELTPRQAARNGREAETLTELLIVALGLMSREGPTP